MDIAKKFGLTHSLLSTVREVVAAERGVREYGVDQERRLVQKQRQMKSEQKKSQASSAPKKIMIAKGKTGGVQMIPKNKYNPKKHVLASGDSAALSPKQKKLDVNKNDKLDAMDFAVLRKNTKQESDTPGAERDARRRAISKVISNRVAQLKVTRSAESSRLRRSLREPLHSIKKESPAIKISGRKENIQMKPKMN